MGDFFLFRYTLKGYATKLEKKHMTYALLAHVIRKGGFIIGQSVVVVEWACSLNRG